MRKFALAASAALFATLAVAASTMPASAGGGVTFGFGGGHHNGWNGHHGGGVTFGFSTEPSYRNNWRRHVRWCLNQYASYDPESNRFFNGTRWRQCNSPFI